jgi:hypothetical protein
MMRKTGFTLLLLALAAAALAAPPKTTDKPPAKMAARTCVPDAPAFWRDQGLATKVATRLQFHKPLFREKVEVKVSGGAAILSGNVSSQALIDEAVRTAAGVGGIKCVQNQLAVGAPAASEVPAPQQ